MATKRRMRGISVSEAEKLVLEDSLRRFHLDVLSTVSSGTAKAYWGLRGEDRLALSPAIDPDNPRKSFDTIWSLFANSPELHDAAKSFVERHLRERLVMKRRP